MMSMSSKGASLALSLGLIALVLVLGAAPLITLSGVTAASNATAGVGGLFTLILESSTSASSDADPAPIIAAAAVYSAPYLADFETDTDGFIFDNTFGDGSGLWHRTTVCESLDPNFHTDTGSLYYGIDTTCIYDTGSLHQGVALSPIIDLTGFGAPLDLAFNYYLSTENATGLDIVTVEVSTNGGTFTTVAGNDGVGIALSDPSGGWTAATIDLSGSSGKMVEIRFGFQTVDDMNNAFPGFYVDDVSVAGTPVTFVINEGDQKLPTATTFQFTTTGNDPNDIAAWTSSNSTAASVDASTGLVTGLTAGTATITATASNSGLTDTVSVTFVTISVTPTTANVNKGDTVALAATSTDASDTAFAWSSDDTSVATVDAASGLVTAVARGTAIITATANGTNFTDTAAVTVIEVIITPSSLTLNKGETRGLFADSNGDSSFTWTSSDTAVATVDAFGNVSGLSGGIATVTATGDTSGASDTAAITVNEVTVTPATFTLQTGTTTTLIASSTSAADTSFTWSSSDGSVATVDSSGVVSGISAGMVVISAVGNSTGASDSATITVVDVSVTPVDPSILPGGTVQLTATSTGDAAFTWMSNDTSVATVDGNGLVTGVTLGTVTITATGTTTGFSDSVTVTVANVVITPAVSFIQPGASIALSAASVDPLDTSFAWSSSNSLVATVDPSGVTVNVTGVAAGGPVTITATGSNSGLSGTANVTVVAVTITTSPPTIANGATVQIDATSNDPNDTIFTWTSSDTAVAVVDATGLVTGVGPGIVTITATGATGASDSVSVQVVQITITPSSLSLLSGDTALLTATSTDPLDTSFIWSTSSALVATVDSTGLVTANLDGIATITATGINSGLSGSVPVTVGAIAITPSLSFIGASPAQAITLSATSSDSMDTITWTSSDLTIAMVDATGLVTGANSGRATITATGSNSGLTATAIVIVGIFPVNPVLTTDGGALTLTAKASQLAETEFNWTSSDPGIVSVDLTTGVITAITPGTATITATGILFGDVMQTIVTVNPPGGGGGDGGSGGGGGGGCFVATAAFGTPMAVEIEVLRTLRDTYLLESAPGALFVDLYYRVSPPMADAVAQYPTLASLVRVVLTPIIALAQLIVMAPVASTIGVIVLLLLLSFGTARIRRRRV